MVKPTTYFTLNLLLPLAIVVGFNSSVLAAQWVDVNDEVSVDLSSISRVSQGVYQYRTRIDSLRTSEMFYRNYYSYERVNCANKRIGLINRYRDTNGDDRMHTHWITLEPDNLQYELKLSPNKQMPEYRQFFMICDCVQQNFQRGVIPPDLEPDWDLKPESYIEADEKIPRWP